MEVHTDASVVLNSTDSLPFEFSQFSHRVIVATMILIVSLVGTFGNSLVILAVLLSMKIRTATNAFVVNLATADLLACLAVLFDAAALLAKDGLPFSELLCSVCAVVENVSIGCSILSLASIAFNRLLLVTRPAIIYRKVYTPKKIAMLLALTWLIPLFLTLLPSFLNLGDFKYDPKYHMCGSSASHPRSKAFRILVAGVLYPSLLVSIIVCYVLIWRHLRRHTKMISYTREEPLEPITYSPTTASTSLADSTPNHTQSALRRDRCTLTPGSGPHSLLLRRQTEITKNMFHVVCAFMLCLTPYAVVLFYGNTLARPYLFVVLLFNSCVNPMIYATKHRDFKTIFGYILRRQWKNIPEPSGVLKALRRSKICGPELYETE